MPNSFAGCWGKPSFCAFPVCPQRGAVHPALLSASKLRWFEVGSNCPQEEVLRASSLRGESQRLCYLDILWLGEIHFAPLGRLAFRRESLFQRFVGRTPSRIPSIHSINFTIQSNAYPLWPEGFSKIVVLEKPLSTAMMEGGDPAFDWATVETSSLWWFQAYQNDIFATSLERFHEIVSLSLSPLP